MTYAMLLMVELLQTVRMMNTVRVHGCDIVRDITVGEILVSAAQLSVIIYHMR